MRGLTCIVLFFITSHAVSAQHDSKKDQIQKLETVYEKLKEKGESSDEVIAGFRELRNKATAIGYSEGVLKYSLQLISHYIKRSDYTSALALVKETESLAEKLKDYKNLSILYGRISEIRKTTGHYEISLRNAQKSLYYAQKIKDPDLRFFQVGFASMQLVTSYEGTNQDSVLFYAKHALHNLEMMPQKDKSQYTKKQSGILFANMYLGNFYTSVLVPQRLDLAEPYYMKAYEFRKKDTEIFKIYDLSLLTALATFYVEKGEYGKAIELSNEALEIEKRKKKPEDRILSFMNLANAYGKLKKTGLQLQYTNAYNQLSDSLNEVEKKAHEQLVAQTVSETDTKYESEKKRLTWGLYLALAAGITAVFLAIRYVRKRRSLIPTAGTGTRLTSSQKRSGSKINPSSIPDKTLEKLLKKLSHFEESQKFVKSEVNLTWLANHLDTNPKYLSEVINGYKGSNFNNYLNSLRIQYIVSKLQNDPAYLEYKISYLAKECGYASAQVFFTAFKKETGMPPSAFIENLAGKKN